jgi:hypothetical protein
MADSDPEHAVIGFPLPLAGAARATGTLHRMTVARSVLLFALAAVAEIGGAWLIWQGVREHRGWLWIGLGVVALGAPAAPSRRQPCRQGRV